MMELHIASRFKTHKKQREEILSRKVQETVQGPIQLTKGERFERLQRLIRTRHQGHFHCT